MTDGAAAAVLMSEELAKALGCVPLASVKSWSYVGVDPEINCSSVRRWPWLGRWSALSLRLEDIDYIDMHEAFAAQVLSVIQALQSDAFGKERFGSDFVWVKSKTRNSTSMVGPWQSDIHLQRRVLVW